MAGSASPLPACSRPRPDELLVALSHALDLGEGHAPGHALRCCWIGQQIGRALGLDSTEMRELHHAVLLKDIGGSASAARTSAFFDCDDLAFKRARRCAHDGLVGDLRLALHHVGEHGGLRRRLRALGGALRQGGEVLDELATLRGAGGAQLARQMSFGDEVADAIQCMDENWDGSGRPQNLAGADIPLYARIAALAQVVELAHTRAGAASAREEVARRSGRRLDPRLADAFAILSRDPRFWSQLGADEIDISTFDPVGDPLDDASGGTSDDRLDEIAAAFGRVVDAKSAFTDGHSTRVARLADRISAHLGLEAGARRWLRRGAWLHDIGKLGVSSAVLDKPGPLDPWEWAAVQRHAASTQQILERVRGFGTLARIAGAHHEKLDGSGYPRGLDTRHIRLETRIITAADMWDALTSARPQRAAMPVEQALQVMRDEVGRTLDGDCLAALTSSVDAGTPP